MHFKQNIGRPSFQYNKRWTPIKKSNSTVLNFFKIPFQKYFLTFNQSAYSQLPNVEKWPKGKLCQQAANNFIYFWKMKLNLSKIHVYWNIVLFSQCGWYFSDQNYNCTYYSHSVCCFFSNMPIRWGNKRDIGVTFRRWQRRR